jgi:hypothetical protein
MKKIKDKLKICIYCVNVSPKSSSALINEKAMNVCQVTNINDTFLPMIKEAGSSERADLLLTYRAALDATKKELGIATIEKIINDSKMSDATKLALIRSLQRSTLAKVGLGVGYSVAGAAGGAAVGATVGLAVSAATAAGAATGGPVGAAIGAVGGLAVGLGIALSKL